MSGNDTIIKHQRATTKKLIDLYGESIVLKRQQEAKRSASGEVRRTSNTRTSLAAQTMAFIGVRSDQIRTVEEGGVLLELRWVLIGQIDADIAKGDTFDLYGTTYMVHEVVADRRWENRAWIRSYGRDAVEA